MKKQLHAVELQEKNNGYRLDFIDQFSREEIEAARRNPGLMEAETLFRELLREEKCIPPDALAVTAFQLGMLLRSQGNYVEARQIFGGIVTKSRLIAEKSNETEWALCRSLLRLAELECGEDRELSRALLFEGMEIAQSSKDKEAISEVCAMLEHYRL